ncbi:MAG: response regulator [Vulcanimicrobiota bacterium]
MVEDNRLIRQMLSSQLVRGGAQVKTAFEGRQALKALESEAFDIVLIDINMPVMNGLETDRAIRLNPEKYRHPIIIALTATNDKLAREACFKAGMDDFLCKPVFYPVLVQSLSAWCKKLSL